MDISVLNIALVGTYLLQLLFAAFFDKVAAYNIRQPFDNNDKKGRETVYIVSFAFLLLINLALIVPGLLLLTNNKSVVLNQTSSIAMATLNPW